MSGKKLKDSKKLRPFLTPKDWEALEGVSRMETERFRQFLRNHPIRETPFGEGDVSFYVGGKGAPTVLIYAGGWGGPELGYETILALEDRHQVIIIDVGDIDQPTDFAEITDMILYKQRIDRVALLGQSLSGILGQVYFRQKPDRVGNMVMALTPAPRKKKVKKWVLTLIRIIPLSLFRLMIAQSVKRLSRTAKPIPEEAMERMAFKGMLMARMFRGYATRRKLLGVLKLVFALNTAGDYSREELSSWPGKLLVITSPDDPYYGDAQVLQEVFPRTEVVSLPEGYGHVTPQVHQQVFFSAIQSFLGNLKG